MGCILIQWDLCLYKKRRLGHREPRGRTTGGGTAVYKSRREALGEARCQQSGHPAARAPPTEPLEACPASLAKAPGLAKHAPAPQVPAAALAAAAAHHRGHVLVSMGTTSLSPPALRGSVSSPSHRYEK